MEDVSTMEYLPCTCIVDNPYFCLEAARNKLQRTNRKFIFWYFENDPEQCILNDRKRQRKQKSQSLIKYLSKQYLPSAWFFIIGSIIFDLCIIVWLNIILPKSPNEVIENEN